jgi:subtilase family serine protease
VQYNSPSLTSGCAQFHAPLHSVRGVTILASSGDDGAVSTSAAGNPLACGYNPSFPATSPYVTAVGGTMVRTVRWVLFAALLVLCAVRCDLSWHCASERHCPVSNILFS